MCVYYKRDQESFLKINGTRLRFVEQIKGQLLFSHFYHRLLSYLQKITENAQVDKME